MEDEKLSGRIIIDTILANMRQQIEELRYSKVVPAAYDVYLHPDDQHRFESLAHEIAAEAVRALQESLDGLNRPSRMDRVRELVRRPRLPYKKVGPWLVRIARDPDGLVPRGRALVVSQIALAGAESFEGQRTRRLATLSDEGAGGKVEHRAIPASRDERREPPLAAARGDDADEAATEPLRAPRPAPALERPLDTGVTAPGSAERDGITPLSASAVAVGTGENDATREMTRSRSLAVLIWEDPAGRHVHRMTGLELTVGRAVAGSTADVRLDTRPDVSRTHFRLRYHPEDRRFSIEDLSLLGTTVNGETLPRGTPRTLLSPAEIRLADLITVRFESEARA